MGLLQNTAEGSSDGVQLGLVDNYDPALEFPSSYEVSPYPMQPPLVTSPSPPPASTTRTTIFRLIRLHSTVLSRAKRVAVLDGHPEVSIGRDVASAARVRLKEMAVSKFHASIYWDSMRHEWGIVDMGSVHGTFVRSAQSHPSSGTSSSGRTLGTRLSDPRKSSMPRVLRHLDEIVVGGTTFLVHEHVAGRPCPECATDGTREIPLFSAQKAAISTEDQSRKRKRDSEAIESDPRRALSTLKSSLLSRHAPSPSPSTLTYKDRSALRRELHPEPRMPQIPLPPPPPEAALPGAARLPSAIFQAVSEPSPPEKISTALSSNNIGHKLLLQQGWSPGMGLGEHPEEGRVEPIDISNNPTRAGLGASISSRSIQPPGGWREQAKQRRWGDMRWK